MLSVEDKVKYIMMMVPIWIVLLSYYFFYLFLNYITFNDVVFVTLSLSVVVFIVLFVAGVLGLVENKECGDSK